MQHDWTKSTLNRKTTVYMDEEEQDGPNPGEECGRWWEGHLGQYCAKAGTEECDFECPYRDRDVFGCHAQLEN